MPLFGPPNVWRLQVKGNTKALIKALRYTKDWRVRNSAAAALGELGDTRAVEPLIAALRDQDRRVRKSAAAALGQMGDPRAVEPLIIALQDQYPGVALSATEALVQTGAPAIQPLIATLRDDNHAGYWYLTQALGQIGAPAVPPLISALRDQHWRVRQGAAQALGRIADAQAVQPLISALRDQHWRVRQGAAQALGKVADVQAVRPLIAALQDEHENVRRDAAQALGRIGMPIVKPVVEDLTDETIRHATVAALVGEGHRLLLQVLDYIISKRDQAEKLETVAEGDAFQSATAMLAMGSLPDAARRGAVQRVIKASESFQYGAKFPDWYNRLLKALPSQIQDALTVACERDPDLPQLRIIKSLGTERSKEFFEQRRQARIARAREQWTSMWDSLSQRIRDLPIVDLGKAKRFLGTSEVTPYSADTLTTSGSLLLYDLEDVLVEAVGCTASNKGDFSELVTGARVVDQPIPHLKAPHSWRQADDAYGTNTFIVVRVGNREFLCTDLVRFG